MKKTLILATALALLAAAGLLWGRSRTPAAASTPPPTPAPTRAAETAKPVQDAEALRREIAELKAELARTKEGDGLKQSVYQAMLEQAQKNLLDDPLAMSWDDFYRVSRSMRVDENTLIQNILLRLRKEAPLSPEQCRDVLSALYEERQATEARFREKYAQRIQAGMLNLTSEESRILSEDILRIRSEVRKSFEPRFQGILPEAQLRLVNEHLRNDRTGGFTSDGNVVGGIGKTPETP